MSYDDEMYSDDFGEDEVQICAGCGREFFPAEEGDGVFCIDCQNVPNEEDDEEFFYCRNDE